MTPLQLHFCVGKFTLGSALSPVKITSLYLGTVGQTGTFEMTTDI